MSVDMRSEEELCWAFVLLGTSPRSPSTRSSEDEGLEVGGEGAMVVDWNWMGIAFAEFSSAVKPEGPGAVLDSWFPPPARVCRLIASSDDPF